MSLRPQPTWSPAAPSPPVSDDDLFVFGTPILYDPVDELRTLCAMIDDSGDETDPEDHETRIRSSWHHRALLGDEKRLLYRPSDDASIEDD